MVRDDAWNRWKGVEGFPCGADTKVHEGPRRATKTARIIEITKDTVQARSDKPSTAKDTKGILAD